MVFRWLHLYTTHHLTNHVAMKALPEANSVLRRSEHRRQSLKNITYEQPNPPPPDTTTTHSPRCPSRGKPPASRKYKSDELFPDRDTPTTPSQLAPKTHCDWIGSRDGRGKKAHIGGLSSYNRYLAVASRAVRRALKEEKAVKADTEIKVAKWAVRNGPLDMLWGIQEILTWLDRTASSRSPSASPRPAPPSAPRRLPRRALNLDRTECVME